MEALKKLTPALSLPARDADAGCVRCPPCLRSLHSGCATYVRRHRDCKRGNALCSRRVYECPRTDYFFTHPTVSQAELGDLYASGFQGRVALTARHGHPRPVAQAAFIEALTYTATAAESARLSNACSVR